MGSDVASLCCFSPVVLHLREPSVREELSLVRPTLGPSALRVQRDDGQARQLADVEVSLRFFFYSTHLYCIVLPHLKCFFESQAQFLSNVMTVT